MHLIGGSPQKEIREIENASVQILRSIFMALAMDRSFEKITKWNGYRCSPQFWAGTSRSKALAGIPSFVQTKFKQVSLICQKRKYFWEIMMLAPDTRILSSDVNDFKCNHSCQTITLIIIDLFYIGNTQVRDLDGSCVEKFKLPKKTSHCTDPIIDNGNAFMSSSRIVQVFILRWCQQWCESWPFIWESGQKDDVRRNCVLLVKFVTQCVGQRDAKPQLEGHSFPAALSTWKDSDTIG